MEIIKPDLLLAAYAEGIFPMAMEKGELGWFSPDPRGIIPLDEFHLPHGLRRFLRRSPFTIRINTAFRDVMLACAEREETWIDELILESYCVLHEIGYAHSVEAWCDDRLAGGLYGVSIAGAFFGESMFCRESNASGAALSALAERLQERSFLLLDTQWTTPHLERFGAREISKAAYLKLLDRALDSSVRFTDSDARDLRLG